MSFARVFNAVALIALVLVPALLMIAGAIGWSGVLLLMAGVVVLGLAWPLVRWLLGP